MVCPLCGYTSNPSGARFCAGCGRLLVDESAGGEPTRPASPWTDGGVGPGGAPADVPTGRPPAGSTEPSASQRSSAGEAGPTGPSPAAQPGGPPPPSNGRPAANAAAGSTRTEAGSRPAGDERRAALGNGRRTDAAQSEPYGLPAGVAALASSSRAWAVAAPVSALVAGFMSGIPALFGVLGADVGPRAGLGGLPAILGPLLVWQLRQKDDPFAAQHGLNALNFNLTILTLAFGLSLFTTLTWGIGALFAVPAGIALVVGWLVCSAIATSRAAKGESYRYPLTFRFVRDR